jgi:hypothetical protein
LRPGKAHCRSLPLVGMTRGESVTHLEVCESDVVGRDGKGKVVADV